MTSQDLPKAFNHQEEEKKILKMWDEAEIGKPRFKNNQDNQPGQKNNQKIKLNKDNLTPFSILMPPPNANASLHAGHAMYVIQDILVRWHRMKGRPTVWFPGTDHAGFESQFVYENHLKKQGKSRFDFDRQTLFNNIKKFVEENSGLIIEQMKALGFSADWSRLSYTLEDKSVDLVLDTFIKLEKEGKVYRDNYLVNYCPKLGTTFADLEVAHVTKQSPLYYINYKFSDGEPRIIDGQEVSYLTVATVRPETILADAALAINPADPRAKALVGEFVLNPLTRAQIPIIADEAVDPEFGTGLLKVTPAHDPTDWQIGQRHNLPIHTTINTMGKIDLEWWRPAQEPLKSRAEDLRSQLHNLSVFHARPAATKLLEAEGSIHHVDENYTHSVAVSYKGNHPIEPMPYPNWFLRMSELAKLGKTAVESGEVRIIPTRFKKQYFDWLNKIHDWPISRQIVWGIRLPIWYNAKENQNIQVTFLDKQGNIQSLTIASAFEKGFDINQISTGLQTLTAPVNCQYVVAKQSPGPEYLQETDTFDTWFSSGQWPLITSGWPNGSDYKTFYPTNVLDTMWDILFFWVARMIMLGKYLTISPKNPTGVAPFKTVYLHSMVTDERGQKMSKSKGNVVNPLEIVDKYGADSLRIALVAGSAPGNPISLSEAKVKGYRNFANKIWNVGRFISLYRKKLPSNSQTAYYQEKGFKQIKKLNLTTSDKEVLRALEQLIRATNKNLEKFRFSDVALSLYDFLWNTFANDYLENNKNREDIEVYLQVVELVFSSLLKLIHPFMPFVTESVWQSLFIDNNSSQKQGGNIDNSDDCQYPHLLALADWPKI